MVHEVAGGFRAVLGCEVRGPICACGRVIVSATTRGQAAVPKAREGYWLYWPGCVVQIQLSVLEIFEEVFFSGGNPCGTST